MANSGDLDLKGILKRNVGCGWFLVLFMDFFFFLMVFCYEWLGIWPRKDILAFESIACAECHIQTMFVNLSKTVLSLVVTTVEKKSVFCSSNKKLDILYKYFELSGAHMLIYILCNCKFKAYLFVWKITSN